MIISASIPGNENLPPEVFAINSNPRIEEYHIGSGQHRILVVDGFYRYPEKILALVDNLFFSGDSRGELVLPVLRAVVPADLSHLEPIIRSYAGECLGTFSALQFVVQGMWGNTPLKDRQRLPHNDPAFGVLVYLNRPEDCSGGTGLYRHRPTGIEFVPLKPDEQMVNLAKDLGYPRLQVNRRTHSYVEMVERVLYNPCQANVDGSMLNDGNQYWELMQLVEMRFNRLVIYDGRIPHTVYLKPCSFEKVPRFVQMLSIEFDANC